MTDLILEARRANQQHVDSSLVSALQDIAVRMLNHGFVQGVQGDGRTVVRFRGQLYDLAMLAR